MQSDIGFVCNQIWGARRKSDCKRPRGCEHQSLDPGLSKDCQLEQDPTTNGDPEMVHPPTRPQAQVESIKRCSTNCPRIESVPESTAKNGDIDTVGGLGAQESFGESVFTLELRPPKT